MFALVLAFAAFAPAHAAPRGEWAFRSGDFPRAVKRVGPAAERGDARAQAYLGFMYQYGRGVPQNYGMAIYWCAGPARSARGRACAGDDRDRGDRRALLHHPE